MYTIFKNESSIILTDNVKFSTHRNFFYLDKINVKEKLLQIENREKNELTIYHPNMELLWKEFSNLFTVIEAAGGIVQNRAKEILFIFRFEKWDLPKGKIEIGEKIEEAALREVEEECGIINVEIGKFCSKTYHIYRDEEKTDILKITHWFHMKSNALNLKPQLDEAITKAEWKNKEQVEIALQNTYPNVKILIEKIC